VQFGTGRKRGNRMSIKLGRRHTIVTRPGDQTSTEKQLWSQWAEAGGKKKKMVGRLNSPEREDNRAHKTGKTFRDEGRRPEENLDTSEKKKKERF